MASDRFVAFTASDQQGHKHVQTQADSEDSQEEEEASRIMSGNVAGSPTRGDLTYGDDLGDADCHNDCGHWRRMESTHDQHLPHDSSVSINQVTVLHDVPSPSVITVSSRRP